MKLKYWIVFAATQLIGAFVPPHANIHSNILPLFASLLLIPGIGIIFFVHNYRLAVMLAIALNALGWHLAIRSLRRQ